MPPEPPPQPARSRGRKGRHFGPRPVADPLDAWLPATRCTAAQRRQADAEAKAERVSLNGLVRLRMFGTAGKRAHRPPSEYQKLIAQGVAYLGRPGSNMNQCARVLNELSIIAREIGADDLLRRIEDMQELYRQTYAEHRECVSEMMQILRMGGFGDDP
jgi:hypothetical protein